MKLAAVTLPCAAAMLAFAMPSAARAGIEACGDIHLEANAECEVVAQGCDVQCTPLSVEAACAAELYANCKGSCEASADVTCEASCYGSCQAECEVDPGAFECQASCEADCSGSCAARCSSEDSECWAACEATCSAECGASCEVTPPQADCVAQCDACCGGSCRAEANLDCQLDCQAEGWAECKVDLQGGCEADCRDAGAALFCDGQYVDHGNNLQECIDSLQAMLNAEVHGEAELTCRPGECTFDSSGMLACSVGGGARPAGAAWALGLIGLGLIGRRRRHVTAISGSRT